MKSKIGAIEIEEDLQVTSADNVEQYRLHSAKALIFIQRHQRQASLDSCKPIMPFARNAFAVRISIASPDMRWNAKRQR